MSHPAPWTLWTGSGDPVTDGSLAICDVTGANGRPPLVFCGELPRISDPRVFLALHHVTDVVKAAAPVMGVVEREAIARSIGVLSPAESEEIIRQNHEQALELERLNALYAENLSVPLAEVIDFFEERAKRRPEEPPVAEPVA